MNRWRGRDLLTVTLLAALFGGLYVAWDWVWDSVAFANTLAPGLRDLFTGFWLSAAIAGATATRRPGGAIATQTLAVAVEMALRGEPSPPLLLGGLVSGGLAELLFALTRHKRYDSRTLMLAGAAAACGSLAVDWLFRQPDFAGEVLAVKLASRVAGGALLGGWLGGRLGHLALWRDGREPG